MEPKKSRLLTIPLLRTGNMVRVDSKHCEKERRYLDNLVTVTVF